MEDPTKQETKKYEAHESRVELITSLCEQFDEKLRTKIDEYFRLSDTIREDSTPDIEERQRTSLMNLNSELSAIETNIRGILTENPELIQSIGTISSHINQAMNYLSSAPDNRYSKEGLIKKFGGKENIPAGKTDYEQTRESLTVLKSIFRGIKVCVNLLK
jgi:hypothetical protein